MTAAIIILSIIILILSFVLITVSINYIQDKQNYTTVMNMVAEKEECFDIAQKLVYDKYNFVLPTSKKYLELAQSRFELEKEHGPSE